MTVKVSKQQHAYIRRIVGCMTTMLIHKGYIERTAKARLDERLSDPTMLVTMAQRAFEQGLSAPEAADVIMRTIDF